VTAPTTATNKRTYRFERRNALKEVGGYFDQQRAQRRARWRNVMRTK
jgi:hypothetical protein